MPIIPWSGDFETGDLSQYATKEDAETFPTLYTGRNYICSFSGRKWSTAVPALGFDNRWPLNETAGTNADDPLGGLDGTYTGGFTLNQTGVNNAVAEALSASVLLNGSTGYVNLGANGVDISSGSWGFFCLVKPTALGAAHRGLFGGPTGSYCASLFNGELNVGVVGGGNLQIPTFSRPATLNQWNAVGISYNASTDTLTRFVDSSTIGFFNVGPYPAANTLTPTGGVKVNQLGRRDAGGYFQGYMQEAMFIVGEEFTYAMFMTLWEDALPRTADKSTIVTPSGPTTEAMDRIVVNAPSFGQTHDRAERHHEKTPLSSIADQVEFKAWQFYFPSDSNWTGSFWQATTAPRWLYFQQLGFVNLTGTSVSIEGFPNGIDGVSGPSMRLRSAGGLTVAGSEPEDVNYIDPNAGNGWNVHRPPSSHPAAAAIRLPQIRGPNTYLNPGSALFALDVWMQFIAEIKWSWNTFTGYIRVWTRNAGSVPWIQVYELGVGTGGPGRKILQYASGQNPPTSSGTFNDMHGGYFGRGFLSLEHFADQRADATSFALAEASFAGVVASTVQLQQRAYRFRNDDGGEASATWKAAENTPITQVPNETLRCRFEIQETGGFSGATGTMQLQYSKNGGAWTNVTATSSVIRTSPSLAVEEDTTGDYLTAGTGTFALGRIDDVDGLVSSVTLAANGHTEHELAFRLIDTDVVANDTVQLRLISANDPDVVYTAIPTITVGTVAAPSDAYADMVRATPGLRGYWRLADTTTVLKDDLGVLDGLYAGGYAQGQPGIPGTVGNGSVDFDGTSGYAEVPDNALLDLGNGPLTIEAWGRRDSIGTVDTIGSKGAGAYGFSFGSDNKLRFGISGGADIVLSAVTLTDTVSLHHFVVTYNGGTDVHLYLDGTDVTATTSAQTLANNAKPLKLGAQGT